MARMAALLLSLACTRAPSTTSASDATATDRTALAASDPQVAVMGRVVVDGGSLRFGYPGVTLAVLE